MKKFSLRKNTLLSTAVIISFGLCNATFALETVWVSAFGSGYGSSEDLACSQAENDSSFAMQDSCRSQAAGNSYNLHGETYSSCNCNEYSEQSFNCSTHGEGLCDIF